MEKIFPELKVKYPHVSMLDEDDIYHPATNEIAKALDVSMA